MFLSAQPLLHLTASSFTMDMVEEPEQPAHTNEPEEEQSIHNVYIYIGLLRNGWFSQHVILKLIA